MESLFPFERLADCRFRFVAEPLPGGLTLHELFIPLVKLPVQNENDGIDEQEVSGDVKWCNE